MTQPKTPLEEKKITAEQYLPRIFQFKISHIDPKSITDKNIYIVKDGKYKMESKLSVDSSTKTVSLQPMFPLVENGNYGVVFEKSLHYIHGENLTREHLMQFTVVKGDVTLKHDSWKRCLELSSAEYALNGYQQIPRVNKHPKYLHIRGSKASERGFRRV